jgi:UTP--glucose-1-phosphate uridylyltransferase
VVGDEPFAILLADDLMDAGESGVPVMRQMVEQFEQHHSSVIAVEEVPLQETSKYGIVSTAGAAGASIETMTGIVEKPRPEAAPSRLAVVGRYLLTARIFDLIRQQSAGAGGEIQLTDAIARLLKEQAVLAYRFEGRRFDCGAKLGYLQASVTLAQRHPEIGADFTRWLGGDRF